MKKSDVFNALKKHWQTLRSSVESHPVLAVISSYLLGVVSVLLSKVFVPLVCLIAISIVVLWLLAEEDESSK